MRALANTQTSYQLPPQRHILLPPAAETRRPRSRVVLERRVSQSQRPQDQTLLPLLAELQLTQSDQARLQALLGPTALHSYWEGKRAVHAPTQQPSQAPGCSAQQLLQLFPKSETCRRFTGVLGLRGAALHPSASGGVVTVEQRALTHHLCASSASQLSNAVTKLRLLRAAATECESRPRNLHLSLDWVREAAGAARNDAPSPLLHYSDASTSPMLPPRPGINELL